MNTNYRCSLLTLMLLAALATGPAVAGDFVVGQKDKAFTVKLLTIAPGDTVNFENNDPFFHNVFSLSPSKSFDLGSYPQDESRPVTFDRVGLIDVECAIHADMHMVIEVK